MKRRLAFPLLAAMLLSALTVSLPTKSEAGIAWIGIARLPVVFIPPGGPPRVVPTFVRSGPPIWIVAWGGFPPFWWTGLARDLTTALPRNPIVTPPGVWGFWDPPTPGPYDNIYYYEIFAGNLAGEGEPAIPAPLDPNLDILDNVILGNYTGMEYAPDVLVDTTFGEVATYIDPETLPNVIGALGSLQAGDRIVIAKHTVMFGDVIEPLPEPASLLAMGAGLAGLAVRVRRKPR